MFLFRPSTSDFERSPTCFEVTESSWFGKRRWISRDGLSPDGAVSEKRDLCLAAELRRAGVSVPSNIAEGYGRGSRREYLQFLTIAQGSLKELETQVLLAERLTYATAAEASSVLSEAEAIGKMLGGLIRSLKAKDV